MAQIVILDGPRGSGKSTTGMLLVERLNLVGIPAEYFKKGQRVAPSDYENMIAHLAKFNRLAGVIVVDRFVATEWVMSTAHRRLNPRRLMNECMEVDRHLQQLNAIHMILLPSIETLTKRLDARGEGGRSWDMDPVLIRPLWETASAFLSSSAPFANETQKDQDHLLAMLTDLVRYKMDVNS